MEYYPEKQDISPVNQSDKGSPGSDTVWETFQSSLDGFTEDIFPAGRDQGVQQERKQI